MPSCCGRTFQNSSALTQHQKAKPHNYCRRCNRFFATKTSLDQHRHDLHGLTPSTDKKSAASKASASKAVVCQLPKANRNHSCGECCKTFVDANALRQHLRSIAHAAEFRCCDCKRDFASLQALTQHLRDKVHKPKQVPPRKQASGHSCGKCSRQFGSTEALKQHLSSAIHQPARLACAAITGVTGGGGSLEGCDRRFATPSAMLHHLESGACSSGMGRVKLNMLALLVDVEGVISSPENAIPGLLREATRRLSKAVTPGSTTPLTETYEALPSPPDSTDMSSVSVILTPSSSTTSSSLASPIMTPTSSYISGPVVRPSARGVIRCALCPPNRRSFPTPQSLQQHLQSPVHDARIFHCPIPISTVPGASALRGKAVVKWFSTLSGMVQHVESGACRGREAELKKAVDSLAGRIRQVGFAARLAVSQ